MNGHLTSVGRAYLRLTDTGPFGPVPVDGDYPPPEIWRKVPVTRIIGGRLRPSVGWRAFVRYPCYTANRDGEIFIGFRYRPRRVLGPSPTSSSAGGAP